MSVRKPPRPIYSFQQDPSIRVQELGDRARILVETGLRRVHMVTSTSQGIYRVLVGRHDDQEMLEFMVMPWVRLIGINHTGPELHIDFQIDAPSDPVEVLMDRNTPLPLVAR